MYRFRPTLVEGVIIDRPNRFIANVEIDGKTDVFHVPCTGKVGGFRPDGLRCLVQRAPEGSGRKTAGTVKAISTKRADQKQYGGDWIAIDQGEMNKYVLDAMRNGQFAPMFGDLGVHLVRPEVTVGDSRLDFLVDGECYVEVKTPLTEICRPLPKALAEQVPEYNLIFALDRLVKHFNELAALGESGHRVIMLTCFGYDADEYHPARTPGHEDFYADVYEAGRRASEAGLETWQANFRISPTGVKLRKLAKVDILS